MHWMRYVSRDDVENGADMPLIRGYTRGLGRLEWRRH
jgi:hypothetical protein